MNAGGFPKAASKVFIFLKKTEVQVESFFFLTLHLRCKTISLLWQTMIDSSMIATQTKDQFGNAHCVL